MYLLDILGNFFFLDRFSFFGLVTNANPVLMLGIQCLKCSDLNSGCFTLAKDF